MAFGKIKADAIIRDNSGTEEEVTMASLVAKAGLASPTFTGAPAIAAATATTPDAGNDSTRVATTAYVQAEGFTKASAENTWTAGQRGEITTVTSGTTLDFDFDLSNNFQVALGHNVTDITVQNATVGQSGSIFLAQPTTGSTTHTVSGWDAVFKFPAGEAPTLSTAINKVDRVDYIIRTTDQIHVVATLDMAV